jgi:mannose-6-phosphate isomerase-like protein (cupin superfamily)
MELDMMRPTAPRITAAVLIACAVPAAAQRHPPPPAPPPGSPATYVASDQIAAALQAAIAKPSDPAASPIGVTDQYSINVVVRGKAAPPTTHPGATELHYILDGSATFVTGGTITKPTGDGAGIIEGGVSRKVHKGDAIIIPAATPHWYNQVDGSITYLEVRFKTGG